MKNLSRTNALVRHWPWLPKRPVIIAEEKKRYSKENKLIENIDNRLNLAKK